MMIHRQNTNKLDLCLARVEYLTQQGVLQVLGDMKRLWKSLESQDDAKAGSNNTQKAIGNKLVEVDGMTPSKTGGKQDVIHVMAGDMKLLWKSFVGPLPDNSGQIQH